MGIKVNGLDRIVIMVRDLDKALAFFGNLGMEFMALDEDIAARDGMRMYVCHETHIHLIAPILPLPEDAPPPVHRSVALLEGRESVHMALTFIVDDPEEVGEALEAQGIPIHHRYEQSHDYASIGLDNFEEVATKPGENTLGLQVAFANHDGRS